MTKEKLILQINDLFLKGYSPNEVLEHYGIELTTKKAYDFLTDSCVIIHSATRLKDGMTTLFHYPSSRSWQFNTILQVVYKHM